MKMGDENSLIASLRLDPEHVGDDCAVVQGCSGKFLLLKVDSVAEDVHFLRSDDPARVGWKALCRPLSDVAAMGGTPKHALVAIFSPPDLPQGYWQSFYRGLKRAGKKFGVTIVGGETSKQTHGIAAAVTLTGEVSEGSCIRRSGGKPGDLLFVTGQLGGSRANHHLDFLPRIAEGRWLAEKYPPHAMLDLSDGLGSDLPRLARASGCGFEVSTASLPVRRGYTQRAALTDGEDYELLFAMPQEAVRGLLAAWPLAFPQTRLTKIGALLEAGIIPKQWMLGWDHFTEPSLKPES